MSTQENQFPFFDIYQNAIKQSVAEGSDILEKAKHCMAPWHILAPYLFEQEKANDERVQPFLEVMGGSPVSIYLAASGAYREAITVLRPLLEMTLVEWYYEAIARHDSQESENFRFLHAKHGFDPNQRVPRIKHDPLFNLPEVKDYRDFVESNAPDEETRNLLLRDISAQDVSTLRRLLNNYAHAHPGSYNIIRGIVEPFQAYDREQLDWWFDMFQWVHEAIVLWIQFIYPIMMWSKFSLTSQFPWLKSDETYPMEVYWSDMLHPLQVEFFSKGL